MTLLIIIISSVVIGLLFLPACFILLVIAWYKLKDITPNPQTESLLWHMAPKTMARVHDAQKKEQLMDAKIAREQNNVVVGDLAIEERKLKIRILERELGINPGEDFSPKDYPH